MKFNNYRTALLCCALGFITLSCDKDKDLLEANPAATLKAQTSKDAQSGNNLYAFNANALPGDLLGCSYKELKGQLQAAIAKNAVEPSECGPTPFDYAINPYALQFGALEWEWYDLMATINQLYTYLDTSKQYFGANGQLTNFAAKHKRNLESFWNMPDEVSLIGQHTSTLQNRDAIAAVYINFAGLTPAQAYANADFIIENIIMPSQVFQATPLLSLDGFATSGDMIVIGDGIVKIMTDAGVDEQVTFAGILGHEWGHQVQFNNYSRWYAGMAQNTPEATRLTELEADFFTGYYLTHKRGATYNWKKTAEFLQLFYNIGDCSFTSSGHHGTPNQRLAAARLGNIIADQTMPKGHILTADQMHALFMAAYNDIIANNIGAAEAKASLATPELKAIYDDILKFQTELEQIIMYGRNWA
ncbi:hypothetical protein [Pontibacter sp. SGAir0037]|uniref:hypothetical protein n=1 Tax=Pontibacter sp. SGAir0037 TaxID=2571030 RepID=UPI0010CD1405|nr:hypothetical protein [Pontibacter sp. SGAir0037]QCR22547.1 hypothetical protein C1N53_09495 [Pontibacter sp. SGAir0037]